MLRFSKGNKIGRLSLSHKLLPNYSAKKKKSIKKDGKIGVALVL